MASAISYINLADDGRITSFSSQVSAMPATNVLVPHVFRRWRGSANSAYFILDLLAVESIDTIGVFGTTMSDSGQVQIQASALDPTVASPEVYDSGVVSVDTLYNAYVGLMNAPADARYVKVTLTDTGSTYVEAGRIFVGLRSSFGDNFSYGWSRSWEDLSIRTKTRGGQTLIFLDNMYRTLEVSFDFITVAERNSFVEELDRLNGLNTDVLLITDTATDNIGRDSIWGLMTDASPVVQPHFDRYSKKYKIAERL